MYKGEIEKTGDEFSNLQPGDYFTKEVEVKYTGSLDATITIDKTALADETKHPNIKNGFFEYDASIKGKDAIDGKYQVTKDEEITVLLKASVPLKEAEKYDENNNPLNRNKSDDVELIIGDLDIQITATQITE